MAAYALSPIDLIPDFIPVIGYLDDLLIVSMGLIVAARMIPPTLMAEYRAAAALHEGWTVSKVAAVVIVGIWIAFGWLVYRAL